MEIIDFIHKAVLRVKCNTVRKIISTNWLAGRKLSKMVARVIRKETKDMWRGSGNIPRRCMVIRTTVSAGHTLHLNNNPMEGQAASQDGLIFPTGSGQEISCVWVDCESPAYCKLMIIVLSAKRKKCLVRINHLKKPSHLKFITFEYGNETFVTFITLCGGECLLWDGKGLTYHFKSVPFFFPPFPYLL